MPRRFSTPIPNWNEDADTVVGAIIPDAERDGVSPYICLWRGIILQAISDALNPLYCNRSHHERYYLQTRARIWLTTMTADFLYVCAMANIDPGALRRRARELIGRERNVASKRRPC